MGMTGAFIEGLAATMLLGYTLVEAPHAEVRRRPIMQVEATAYCDQGETASGEQTRRGAWLATPWIRMDVGRAQGTATHRLLFGCDSITTAHALRALLRCL